tara:strand:- start:205 stop:384 length:180 start_codon:yes stop_codon:yes gene_type:complete
MRENEIIFQVRQVVVLEIDVQSVEEEKLHMVISTHTLVQPITMVVHPIPPPQQQPQQPQ